MGPYERGRPCSRCKAELKTTNPGPECEPCSIPSCEHVEEEDPISLAAERIRMERALEGLEAA
jgi:hypothetical protein